MKTAKVSLLAIATLIIAACSSSKKVATPSVSSAPASTTAPAPNFIMVKPADGIRAPGDEELAAIQVQYKDITMDKLREGHVIYTQGACVKCHGTISIYKYDDLKWKYIIADMAQRAQLSDGQKDAVYKYVLAMKSTQPK